MHTFQVYSLFLSLYFVSFNLLAGDHHIFFVHGLAGTKTTFGAMPDQLTKQLNKTTNDRTFTYVFSYPTENDSLDAYDFSKSLAKFVEKKLQI